MKKITISFFVLACVISGTCIAQNPGIAEGRLQPDFIKLSSSSQNSASPVSTGSILLNNINIKAARDFMESYRNPTDIRWTILTDGFRVHFYCDSIQTRIFYNKWGNRETLIRNYSEDKLPFAVRHLVKSNYYDFNIFNVTEVNKGDKTLYLVKIEDKTWWKTIKVADGEMEVLEEYLKS